MITAIIMASGFSKRMGRDKLLLKINEETLVERTIKTIKKSKVDNIIIIYRDERIKYIAKNHDVFSVYNKNAKEGQSESIKLGIKATHKSTDGYMFFVSDQPFLNSEIINQIIDKFKEEKEKIIIPLYDGKKGNPVIFPKFLKKELLEIKGDTGGKQVIKNNLDSIYYIKYNNSRLGLDIDTIEDYRKIINKGE